MTYNIEAWCRFLGNPLDGSARTNFVYFIAGHQRSVGVITPADVDAAERFIKLNDGKHQLYSNINPCGVKVSGKPKDIDIPAVKNLYVDIDPVKATGMGKYPATDEEIATIPIGKIVETIRGLAGDYYFDKTGNGYRAIVPVKDATQIDERNLVCYLHSVFPDYIDTNVTDPSRITGIPGTMNVKEEVLGRPNRMRENFPGVIDRFEVSVPKYTEEQHTTIDEAVHRKRQSNKDRPTRALYTPKESDTQLLINRYILRCAERSPWVLKLIESGPPEGLGFQYDGFFAADVLNKVGDAPRVYATIMRSLWGEGYNGRVTEKAWDDAVDSGAGAWTTGTVRRMFGNSIFEVK